MHPYRFLVGLVALAACMVSEAAPAEYEATVQQTYVAQRALQKIALASFACPRELECAALEKKLVERIAEDTKLKVLQSDSVREIMEQANLKDLEQSENRLIIAEGLGIQAYAYLTIKNTQVDVVAPPEHDKWKDIKRETSVKRASLELRVISPDGASLAQVSGDAQLFGSAKSLETITTHLLEVMLEKAWP